MRRARDDDSSEEPLLLKKKQQVEARQWSDYLPLELWHLIIVLFLRPYQTWYSMVRSTREFWTKFGGLNNIKKVFPGTQPDHIIRLSEYVSAESMQWLHVVLRGSDSTLPRPAILAGGFVRQAIIRAHHAVSLGIRVHDRLSTEKARDMDFWYSVPDVFHKDEVGAYHWTAEMVNSVFHLLGLPESLPLPRAPHSPVWSQPRNFRPVDIILSGRSFRDDGPVLLGFDMSCCQYQWDDTSEDILTTPLAMHSLQTGQIHFVNEYTEEDLKQMCLRLKERQHLPIDLDSYAEIRQLRRVRKYIEHYGYEHAELRPLLLQTPLDEQHPHPDFLTRACARYARNLSPISWDELLPIVSRVASLF